VSRYDPDPDDRPDADDLIGMDATGPLDTSAIDDLVAELTCRHCGWPHVSQGCLDGHDDTALFLGEK
jgi:hypothetical protein